MLTTVTVKGQVTIPKPVRDQLGIVPGDAVEFRLVQDGSVILVKSQLGDKARKPPPVSRFAALLGSAGPGLSTDEIMAMTRGDDYSR